MVALARKKAPRLRAASIEAARCGRTSPGPRMGIHEAHAPADLENRPPGRLGVGVLRPAGQVGVRGELRYFVIHRQGSEGNSTSIDLVVPLLAREPHGHVSILSGRATLSSRRVGSG